MNSEPVVGPGFTRGAAKATGGGANLLFSIIFVENCMKMKQIGLREGMRVPVPPRSPTENL